LHVVGGKWVRSHSSLNEWRRGRVASVASSRTDSLSSLAPAPSKGMGPGHERHLTDPNCPAHLQHPQALLHSVPGTHRTWWRDLQVDEGTVPTSPQRAGNIKAREQEWRAGPPNLQQTQGSPLPPASSRKCPGWLVEGSQDGGGQYSQSPLEPVLVNMVPLGPEPPRGSGGGEVEVESPVDRAGALPAGRRIRCCGALQRRRRKAQAQQVGCGCSFRALPFLPGPEVCRPREGPPSVSFRRLRTLFGKGMGWCGKGKVQLHIRVPTAALKSGGVRWP
jgi:hypothetical protein